MKNLSKGRRAAEHKTPKEGQVVDSKGKILGIGYCLWERIKQAVGTKKRSP
jgi:hypothetical protein